jgi:hypothetical protein
MNIRMNAVLALCLLAVVGLPARAQEEQTPDERLKQKVTYSASAVPLEKVAEELTKKTGVILRAGSGERDWKDRERRVHVHLHDVPLAVALQGISKTLGFELRRSGDEGKWIYRIYQSARGRDYEAAMLSAQKEEKEREIVALREGMLSEAEDALALTPEEAAKLKDKDPWKAYLGGTDSGRAYAELLRGLPGDARELMLRGRKVNMDVGELTPAMRDAMQRMVAGSFLGRMDGPGNNPLRDMWKNTDPARLTFMPLGEEMIFGPVSAAAMGMAGLATVMGDPKNVSPDLQRMMDQFESMGMGRGVPLAGMPVAGSGSMAGRMFGQMMNRLESGESWQNVERDLQNQMQNPGSLADDPAFKVTPSPKPADPALHAEVEPIALKAAPMMSQESQSAELIRELGKRTKVAYVAEFHPESIPLAMALPSTKQPLHRLLDGLQRAGLQWEYENGLVRLRPKDWAVRRSYDVPQSLLDGYKKILEAKGWLDLEALSGLCAALTDGQIMHRVLKEPEFSPYLMTLMPTNNSRDLLRFYGDLNPAQRARLRTPEGLPFDRLTEAQWQRLAAWVEDETAGAEVRPGRVLLTVKEDEIPAPPQRRANPDGASTPPGGESPPGPNLRPTPDAKPGANAGPTAATAAPTSPPSNAGTSPAPAKPDSAPPSPPEVKPGSPTSPTDSPPPGPRAPVGPQFVRATFTLEMEGDEGEKPLGIAKRVSIPTRAFLTNMKQAMEQMRKQAEEQQKRQNEDNEGNKPSPEKNNMAPPSPARGTPRPGAPMSPAQK